MATPRTRLPSRAGFTLIETLVVMIIIGIVVGMVLPRWSTMGTSTKANAAAGVVMTDLQRTFNEAQKNKRPVRLVVDVGNRLYTATDRATGAVIFTRRLTGATTTEYQVSGMTSVPATIDVFPNGLASAGIVITITVAAQTRTVTMTRVGHVRIS
ncbi:MAG: prepilin-type N-terminal cleavage/methylation domain-containing protein [Gemmatimonadota bacterium]